MKQRKERPPELSAETAEYVKRHIITPAMQELGERLSRLYSDIVEAVDLTEQGRSELNALLNMGGVTYPLNERLKDIMLY